MGEYSMLEVDYDGLYESKRCEEENRILGNHLKAFSLLEGDVLDLGAGTGLVLKVSYGQIKTYTALDVSAKMLLKIPESPRVRRMCCDMDNLKGLDRYDSIVSTFGSFSYSLKPEKVLAQCHESLKDRGRIYLMPFAPRWGFGQNVYSEGNGVFQVRNFYTPEQLTGMMKRAGFKILDVRPVTVGLDWLPSPLWCLEGFLVRKFPRLGLYLSVVGEKI